MPLDDRASSRTRECKVYFSRRFLATPLLAKILTEEICGKKRIIVEGAE
jgi:hypothetical protein